MKETNEIKRAKEKYFLLFLMNNTPFLLPLLRQIDTYIHTHGNPTKT